MTRVNGCPACAGTRAAAHLEVKEMMFGADERFEYVECADCGTLRLLDVPTDLSPYYPQNYYSVELDPEGAIGRPPVRQFVRLVAGSALFGTRVVSTVARTALRKREFRTLMSILGGVRAAGLPRGRDTRVLDVGCGSGMLVYALSLAGLSDVLGSDPFAPHGRTFDTGATIEPVDLDQVTGTFDLVMFHHSFEHVPDPSASLGQAAELLSDQGRILVRMPTVSSEAFRRFGPDWVQLDAPRHLTIFSRDGMQQLASRHGLEVTRVVDDSTSFQFWGSEQVRRGIALTAQNSHMVSVKDSAFTRRDIARWDRAARAANARSSGDQAAWVLAPVR
jgi:SAM-dependent methyltransferase